MRDFGEILAENRKKKGYSYCSGTSGIFKKYGGKWRMRYC